MQSTSYHSGTTVVTEAEMHSSHVLDSFLQIGSVEAVRRTPDGKIEVYRSSENLVCNSMQ